MSEKMRVTSKRESGCLLRSIILSPLVPDPEMNKASRIFLSLWGYIGVIAMSQENGSRDIRLTNPHVEYTCYMRLYLIDDFIPFLPKWSCFGGLGKS